MVAKGFSLQGIKPWLYIIKSVYNLLFLLPICQVLTNEPALDDHKQKIPYTKKNYFTLNWTKWSTKWVQKKRYGITMKWFELLELRF